ncbi:MAG: hypothetical protein Q9165_006964 [Trypethelium subeluteriae]
MLRQEKKQTLWSSHADLRMSQPPNNQNPTPSAALAASQAFLNNRASNASLSSAAAATALRSLTTSPEPVGNIRTKRMQRRNSQSSNGSAPANPRAGLQRQNSSGSMTERSFRSPSPNRPQSSQSAPDTTVPAAYDAPPVPALPASVSMKLLKQGKRASSLEPTPAPKRSTQQTAPPGERAVSIDRSRNESNSESNYRTSVNFSRPLSPSPLNTPPESPVSAPRPKSMGGWQTGPIVGDTSRATGGRPASTVGVPSSNGTIQQKLESAANQPAKKKKKNQAAPSTQGSHLATGGMHVGPTGTAVPNGTLTQTTAPSSAPAAKTAAQRSNEQTVPNTRPRPKKQGIAGAGLVKQPSMVREDREAEEQANKPPQRPQTSGGPTSIAKQAEPSKPKTSVTATDTMTGGKSQQQTSAASSTVGSGSPSSSSLQPIGNGRTQQESSQSPARSAHFSSAPLLAEKSGVRHSPPPRSLSPAKSALKHSPGSIRGTSPATSQAGRAPGSDMSDTASQMSEDGKPSSKKKKKVRVSFDEGATVVTADPVLGSVQERSLNPRPNRFDFDEEDTSDILKPRPVLPSFGSVRGRKTKAEEEPLEKVTETVPSSMTTSTSTIASPQEISSDQAIGGVFAQDQASKNEKVPQSDKPTPLPPEVTSREGLTYGSDSDTDEDVPVTSVVPNSESPRRESLIKADEAETVSKNVPPPLGQPESDIGLVPGGPDINVQPPTPAAIEESKEPSSPVPGAFPEEIRELASPVPGAFPNDPEEDIRTDNAGNGTNPTDAAVHSAGSSEEPLEQTTPQPLTSEALARTGEAIEATNAPQMQSEDAYETDEDSIYSDAAEDPSELEGGFASLDAILESPMQPQAESSIISTPPDSPSTRLAKNYNPTAKSPTGAVDVLVSPEAETPSSAQDWNKTKTYWSSLSDQRKKEMEQQAQPESAPIVVSTTKEATVPTVATPKPKPKKKKTTTQSQTSRATLVENSRAPRQRPQSTENDSIPPMRQTMRSTMRQSSPEQAPSATHLRQSMRSGGTMRTSMCDGPPSPKQVAPVQSKEPRGALQKKNVRPARASPSSGVLGTSSTAREIAASSLRAQMQRPATAANDSDSESSFRKKKRGDSSTVDGGRYTMKRSMRDGPAGQSSASPGENQSTRFSIRSLSPQPAPSSRGGMRSSMRTGSLDIGRPPRDTRSPSRFSISSFGRSSKPQRGPAPPSREPAKSSTTSRFKSRFADSSDEEEDDKPRLGSRFRSRFADSDDESDIESPPLPAGLTPVRGIPARQDDRESTDLSDEEDQRRPGSPPAVPSSNDVEQALTKRPQTSQAAPVTNGNAGKALASGSLREPGAPAKLTSTPPPKRNESRTRRFFGLGKKKPDLSPLATQKEDDESGRGPNTQAPLGITTTIGPGTPIKDQIRPSTPPSQGTPTAAKSAHTASSPSASPTTTRPRSPKLQRRNTPQLRASLPDPSSWPLPESVATKKPLARPSTSDGTPRSRKGAAAARPEMGPRVNTEGGETVVTIAAGEGVGADGAGVVYGRRGRPKRFQALRRAFGLRD